MTQADLAEFQSEWVEPISTNYHGYDVFELPPPGQGFAALEMLNILEVCVPKLGINLADARAVESDVLAPDGRGEEARLLRSAGEERRPEVRQRAGRSSCCRRRTPRRCAARSIRTRPRPRRRVTGGTDGGTIYLTTADRWGNMVSLIHSVFSVYGSRATVGAVRLRAAQPRQRRSRSIRRAPTSSRRTSGRSTTIIAGFVMKDGQPLMTFGNMGGSVQPETHAQHMVNLIDLGMNVQMTTDAARFTHNQNNNVLSLETNLFNLVGAALKAKANGHARPVNGDRSAAIRASCSRAILAAGADLRSHEHHATTCRSTASIARDRIIARTARPSAGEFPWAGMAPPWLSPWNCQLLGFGDILRTDGHFVRLEQRMTNSFASRLSNIPK